MNTDRRPKKALDWIPPGRQQRGRPGRRRTQGIEEAMTAGDLQEGRREKPGDWDRRNGDCRSATSFYVCVCARAQTHTHINTHTTMVVLRKQMTANLTTNVKYKFMTLQFHIRFNSFQITKYGEVKRLRTCATNVSCPTVQAVSLYLSKWSWTL
jgi:hypothetical protein